MEPLENGAQPGDAARIASREEHLIGLYMKLTGASASQARNVYAYLEVDDGSESGPDHAWPGWIEPSTPLHNAPSETGNRPRLKHGFPGGGRMFEPGTASAPSAAGGG